MLEGVSTPTAIAERTGLTFHTARRWMSEVRTMWAQTYTPAELRDRAEAAYEAAGEALFSAWSTYERANTSRDRLASLRLALVANRQRALICGVLSDNGGRA